MKPVAWRYENKNVKGNWYITWTEPPDEFNKRPLYESQDANRIEELERERDTVWAQAHRLALELECLIMDTKDNAVVSKWWDSAFEAIEEYQALKPGADEESEALAKIRKVGI